VDITWLDEPEAPYLPPDTSLIVIGSEAYNPLVRYMQKQSAKIHPTEAKMWHTERTNVDYEVVPGVTEKQQGIRMANDPSKGLIRARISDSDGVSDLAMIQTVIPRVLDERAISILHIAGLSGVGTRLAVAFLLGTVNEVRKSTEFRLWRPEHRRGQLKTYPGLQRWMLGWYVPMLDGVPQFEELIEEVSDHVRIINPMHAQWDLDLPDVRAPRPF
jgi:hypothetical protein